MDPNGLISQALGDQIGSLKRTLPSPGPGSMRVERRPKSLSLAAPPKYEQDLEKFYVERLANGPPSRMSRSRHWGFVRSVAFADDGIAPPRVRARVGGPRRFGRVGCASVGHGRSAERDAEGNVTSIPRDIRAKTLDPNDSRACTERSTGTKRTSVQRPWLSAVECRRPRRSAPR